MIVLMRKAPRRKTRSIKDTGVVSCWLRLLVSSADCLQVMAVLTRIHDGRRFELKGSGQASRVEVFDANGISRGGRNAPVL